MINSISFMGATEPQTNVENKAATPQFRGTEPNTLERIPVQDSFEKENNTGKKVAIGAVAAVGLATAADFIFAKGKHVKKLLGMAEKEAKNAKPEGTPEIPQSATKERTKEADKIYKEIDAKLHKKTETNAETVERNLAPKEKPGSWTKEDIQNYYKELEVEEAEKAAKEAAEKAQKELQAKYTQEMDPIAIEKAMELKKLWNKKLDTYSAIYNKGFENVSRGKTVTRLEDGTYKVVSSGKHGSTEYLSKDGKVLDEIRVLNKDGNLNHTVEFGRDQGKSADIYVYNKGEISERIDFITESRKNGDRICNWHPRRACDKEGLTSLYIDGKDVHWNALPSQEVANGCSLNHWITLPE